MRHTIILNILISVFFSNDLMAQLGKTTLSLGGGQFLKNPISKSTTSTFTVTENTTTFTPHIALTLERQINQTLSIGGSFHYLTAQSVSLSKVNFNGGGTSINQEGVKSTVGGMSFNSKVFFYSDSDFDIYAGGSLGIVRTSDRRTVNNLAGNNQVSFAGQDQQIKSLLEMNIGGRCFITENLGFYGEVGYLSFYLAKAMAGQAGIIFRF